MNEVVEAVMMICELGQVRPLTELEERILSRSKPELLQHASLMIKMVEKIEALEALGAHR